MILRILGTLALGVALTACTMGLGEKLDPRLVQSFKLQQITVAVAPDAKFWWAEGERAYALSIGRTDFSTTPLGETPEGRAYMSQQAAQRIKAAFDHQLIGRMNGTRPVRVEVVMDDIYISSPVQQVVLGASFRMHGSARLVDVKTGEVIAVNPNLTTTTGGGSGVLGTMMDRAIGGDPMDRLAAVLAESYRDWLLLG
jgi:hypothetical protein